MPQTKDRDRYDGHGVPQMKSPGDVCHQMHQLMVQRLNLRRKIDILDLQIESARLAETKNLSALRGTNDALRPHWLEYN